MNKIGKFGNSQKDYPLNECTFVFENRTVKVAYAGSCIEALEQYHRIGRCSQEEIANILEIKEKNLREAS